MTAPTIPNISSPLGIVLIDPTTGSAYRGGSNIIDATSYGADPTGATSSTVAIQAAIDAAWNSGGGMVWLPANPLTKFYSVPTKLVARPGVTVQGAGYEIADGTGAFTRGTILKGDGTQPCFSYNDTDLSVQPSANALQASRLSGFNLSGLAFDTFSYACRFGGRMNTGLFHSNFEHLYANNCTTWGFWFENCSIATYFNMIVRLMATNSVGCMAFVASQTAYNHGNSDYESFFVEPVADRTRGICFWAKDGAKFNDNNGRHIQTNTGSSGKITQAATMANASPNITVVDGTKYPVDMPVTVSASQNGFNQYQTYFVISNAANVLQLSNYMKGTAVNATGNTAVNLDTYGFPGMEIVGFKDDASNRIQPSEFTGIDMEGYATTLIVAQTCDLSLSIGTLFTGQGTYQASSLCTRDMNGLWESRTPLAIDFNSSNKLWCKYSQLTTDSDTKAVIQTTLPAGCLFDRSSSAPFMSMGTLLNGNSTGLTYNNFGSTSMWITRQIMANRTSSSSTTSKSLAGQDGGSINYTGSTATTWTLPALVDGLYGGSGSSAGWPITITNNASAGVVLTVAASGSDKFRYRGATKASYDLARGQSITLIAQYDNTGSFWQVVSLNPPELSARPFATKTANYTMTVDDSIIYADATSGNVTITLPLANVDGTTRTAVKTVKRIDSSGSTVTINTSGTDTIDGAATTTLGALAAKDFSANGVTPAGDWKVV